MSPENGSRSFFLKSLKDLPAQCQEGVEEIWLLLQRVEKQKKWPQSRTLEELNFIIPQAKNFSQEFMDRLRPFKVGDNSWNQTVSLACALTQNTLERIGRKKLMAATWGIIGSKIIQSLPRYYASRDATWDTVWALSWALLKDKPGFENNAYFPDLLLCELGAVSIYFYPVSETPDEEPKETLVVDFPVRLETNEALACLVFPDGQPGDQKALYTHPWARPCSEIAPFTPSLALSRIIHPRKVYPIP